MKYVILHPTQPNSGMFAFIWQTIRGMYHYPNEKYYVYFGQECCYYDPTITHTNNVWEYYFSQPHTNILHPDDEIVAEVGLLFDEFSEFNDLLMKSPTKEFIYNRRCEYNKIIKNNVNLLPHINDKINLFRDGHFKGKKILGIHCRGTDHPDKRNMDDYIPEISRVLDEYDLIFASSDEEMRISKLKSVFGSRLITYDALRSPSEMQLHYYNSIKRPYKIGEDVIIESYLLSHTNFLLCCTGSNVNFYTRALNPNLNFKYI